MLTKRYLPSAKNLAAIMKKIVEGTAPKRFTITHLKSIGFKSSNDHAILPMLKDLGFLTADGVPTQRYHNYRDPSRSKAVMAEALREAYDEIFHINENPTDKDRDTIKGKFKSTHNVSNDLADVMAKTFYALLKLADMDAEEKTTKKKEARKEIVEKPEDPKTMKRTPPPGIGGLNYNIEIHLPATKDIDVFNAIFKSLKEHILD